MTAVNITETYDHFIKANEEASSQHLPRKGRKSKKKASSDPRAVSARERVNKAFDVYTLCPNRDNIAALQKEIEGFIVSIAAQSELENYQRDSRKEKRKARNDKKI